jgi:MOSC domain-containing protein YiiM
MRIVSVNVGLPRRLESNDRATTTAILKEPVVSRVRIRRLNLDGDRQADLRVHGGPAKAVYAYPVEHYGYWQDELERELAFGSFGENLTVEGLPLEDELAIGDRLRAGTAELVVTQPRIPCFKLGMRFRDPRMVKRFLAAGRTGYYLSVAREGHVETGDTIEVVSRHPAGVSVAAVTRAYAGQRRDASMVERLASLEPLPHDWRAFFGKRLASTVG